MTEDRIAELKRMLIAHEAARLPGAESAPAIESTVPDNAPLPANHEVLARVDVALTADPASADPATFSSARDTLYTHAESALGKLSQGATDLSPDQLGALEAIVIADGTRPSFLLSDGKPDLGDPFMGNWADLVSAHSPAMRKIAQAVGRIQPAKGHASRYVGTGTLIDSGAQLVLTNYHVIDDARVKSGVAMTQSGPKIRIDGVLEIDFVGEAASLESNRFRIVSVELPVGFGRGFGVIDAAVARIEPVDASSQLPATVPVLSRDPSYANGGMTSLSTVGFPGPPPLSTGIQGKIDWGFVTKTLFRNKFGFKRLAPGVFTSARGTNPKDKVTRTAFGHNATTFGGASGSLIAAWADTDAPSFGLHFVGATGIENNALAFAAAADALAAIGVPFA